MMTIKDRKFQTIGVPIDSYGVTGGTELGPDALRNADLPKVLGAIDAGDLPVSIRDSVRDPESGIIGYRDVCNTTLKLRQYVREFLEQGSIPVLLGGCCTQLMGAIAGARDHFGEIGLIYADGHLDLYDGVTSPTGEAADIPLGVLLGWGPKELLEAIGPSSPLNVKNTVLLGYRDYEEAKSLNSLLPEQLGPEFLHIGASTLLSSNLQELGEKIATKMSLATKQFFLHIDVDILDESEFPATDYLMPGGLNWDQFTELLTPIGNSPYLAGVAISCYNPEKDVDNICGKKLVMALAQILGK